jgi:hypothetical protein
MITRSFMIAGSIRYRSIDLGLFSAKNIDIASKLFCIMPRTSDPKKPTKPAPSKDKGTKNKGTKAKGKGKTKGGVVETVPLYTRCAKFKIGTMDVPLSQCQPHPEPIRGIHKDSMKNIKRNVRSDHGKGKNAHTHTHTHTQTQHAHTYTCKHNTSTYQGFSLIMCCVFWCCVFFRVDARDSLLCYWACRVYQRRCLLRV